MARRIRPSDHDTRTDGDSMILFDGRTGPTLRSALGGALAQSTRASFAVRRIRLARVDLEPREMRTIESIRVLLGRLDADTLADAAMTSSARTATLLDLAASGRLEVRSASLLAWDPDFALIGSGTESDLLVLGSIQFTPPVLHRPAQELALACALRDPAIVRTAGARFEELWLRAHDALEVVTDALCRSRSAPDA
jgi:hypothetical protein